MCVDVCFWTTVIAYVIFFLCVSKNYLSHFVRLFLRFAKAASKSKLLRIYRDQETNKKWERERGEGENSLRFSLWIESSAKDRERERETEEDNFSFVMLSPTAFCKRARDTNFILKSTIKWTENINLDEKPWNQFQ